MGSGQNNGNGGGWFLDFGGMEDEVQTAEFIWPSHFVDDPTAPSTLELDLSRKEDSNCENASKKRSRVSSCPGPGTKACREKMRRDRLNDRFIELCSLLDPGRPPKADKVAVLSDATHCLNQLRLEAEKLKESNESLQEMIKGLKGEKMELRDEKVRLKAKKDQLEQVLKGMSIPSPFVAQPVAAPFHLAAYAACSKNIPYPNYSPIGVWQWILPPASLDTSQDHVLRPPVA